MAEKYPDWAGDMDRLEQEEFEELLAEYAEEVWK